MKFNENNLKLNIFECKTFFQRLIGFMFKIKKIDYGLLFRKCNSIHTFFMFQSIDIIMTDNKNNILYMFDKVRPFRIIFPRKNVTKVYELPLGSIMKIES